MTVCVRKHKNNMYTSKTQYSWHDTHTKKHTTWLINGTMHSFHSMLMMPPAILDCKVGVVQHISTFYAPSTQNFESIGRTCTTPSSKFNMATPFISVGWKLFFVSLKSRAECFATSTCTRFDHLDHICIQVVVFVFWFFYKWYIVNLYATSFQLLKINGTHPEENKDSD